MKYIDGFVLVVPKKNLKLYKKMAAEAGDVWKRFGALEYYESIGDDLYPKSQDKNNDMKMLNFPKLTKLKKMRVFGSLLLYIIQKNIGTM